MFKIHWKLKKHIAKMLVAKAPWPQWGSSKVLLFEKITNLVAKMLVAQTPRPQWGFSKSFLVEKNRKSCRENARCQNPSATVRIFEVRCLKLLWCSYLNIKLPYLHSEWRFYHLTRNKAKNRLTATHQFYWIFFKKSPSSLVFHPFWNSKNIAIEQLKITSRKRALPKTLGHNGDFWDLPPQKTAGAALQKNTPSL